MSDLACPNQFNDLLAQLPVEFVEGALRLPLFNALLGKGKQALEAGRVGLKGAHGTFLAVVSPCGHVIALFGPRVEPEESM
jgi:hypothetical protein